MHIWQEIKHNIQEVVIWSSYFDIFASVRPRSVCNSRTSVSWMSWVYWRPSAWHWWHAGPLFGPVISWHRNRHCSRLLSWLLAFITECCTKVRNSLYTVHLFVAVKTLKNVVKTSLTSKKCGHINKFDTENTHTANEWTKLDTCT